MIEAMTAIVIRAGNRRDTEWLYELFSRTMREFIDATWGWDELLQREAFFTNLPGHEFCILEIDKARAGGFHVAQRTDHLWLEMLLIAPERQRKGLGRMLLEKVKEQASSLALPIRLNVLKVNPAQQFYRSQEFEIVGEDIHRLSLQWQPPGN